MKEKFLPIGTVILMKDATKRLMITGYCSSTPDNSEKVYDYVGCLFPEGNLAGEEVALFDHSQIGSVLHMGLNDQEFEQLNHQLLTAMGVDNSGSEKTNDGVVSEGMMSPTPFDSDVVQREKVDMSVSNTYENNLSLSDSSVSKEDENIISDLFPSVNFDEGSSSNQLSPSVGSEGSPVLQLQPIYGDGMVDMSSSNLTSGDSSNTNIDLPFALPVFDNSNI